MKPNTCFAIFVKTPGLSPIKTRLATRIGSERAEQFHCAAAQAVASVCMQLKAYNVDSYFAVAEQENLLHTSVTDPSVWNSLPQVFQSEGELGRRMWKIYSDLRVQYENVFLIGADVPQIEVTLLSDMLNWITSMPRRLAVAPSEDGGFWCFGGNVDIPLGAWNSVQYSAATTLNEFSKRIMQYGELKNFQRLTDVDEFDDLMNVHQTLIELASPTEQQKELCHLLTQWIAH